MAWTYFTADLSPGEIITQAQYAELIDAIEERMLAAHSAPYIEEGERYLMSMHADMADVKAGPIKTTRVRYTRNGSTTIGTIFDVLGLLSRCYRQDRDKTYSFWTDPGVTVWSLAATARGLQSFRLEGPVESAAMWNCIRDAIRLLKYPVVSIGASGSGTWWEKTSAPQASAAIAISACVADTPGSIGTATRFSARSQLQWRSGPPPYEAFSNYRGVTVSIPDIAPFSNGYDVHAIITDRYTNAAGEGADLAEIAWGSSSATSATNSTTAVAVATGITTVGSISADVRLASYGDTAKWADYVPTYAGQAATREIALDFTLTPTFTHP